MKATIILNQEHNGIEIAFGSRPSYETRAKLKENGFRWHNGKKLWYARRTAQRMKFAESLTGSKPEGADQTETQAPPKKNKFGVKVGDIFFASWGYDQTNVDFFQVVELVGTSSVRVRGVCLPLEEERGVGPMSADRKYKVVRDILPAVSSVFIKDDEKGDLKRLKSYDPDGVSNPSIKIANYCDAHLVQTDTIKTYESWYA